MGGRAWAVPLVRKRSSLWVVWACCWVPGPLFAAPGRHPWLAGPSWVVSAVAWWWLENWIVDASDHGWPLAGRGCCMFFAGPLLFRGLVDRLMCFCDLDCVDVSSGRLCAASWSRGFALGGRVVGKGVWWMPWQTGPMKGVWGCDKPRGAADRALIRGFPNGVTRRPSWAGTVFERGVRREVKHLSTCRKRYSVSSGERKRMMAKPLPCDTRRGLR